ncbi:MAG: energy transducer TonB [Bacteroidaceae bacterium]|nr:energy transducer TonB [Bacteroidaceae bacterium]
MKKALFLLFILAIGQFISCGTNKSTQRNDTSYVEAKDKIETDKVYQVVEKMPEFPGGKQRLLNWVMKNIQYPAEARRKGVQGRVVITFVINKNGKAVEPLIVQSVDPLLDKEAIRLVNSMPKWEPGEEKGEPVRVKFTMPINFRLSGGNLRR